MPSSTVHRVLVRHGMNRLAWIDRPTGRVVRRIETSRPGELIHVDVKKLARIPTGGGHKVLGRDTAGRRNQRRGTGYTYVHSAVDAFSRLAYSEISGPETIASTTAFLLRAHRFFAEHGVKVERILTDNGVGYRSHEWARLCRELDVVHTRTKPYHPQTNGKVERYNRTLLDEWAYTRLFKSEAARARKLDAFLHRYNHHRHHTAVGGPPIGRVTNLVGQHN
jgi:transposase InsO family protein